MWAGTCKSSGSGTLQEWKNYLYMLKQKSKSTADEELTDELSAMTNSEDAINVIEP